MRHIKIEVYFFTNKHGPPRVGMTLYNHHIPPILLFHHFSKWDCHSTSRGLFQHQASYLHTASRKEEWQREGHKASPRTLPGSYAQHFCLHSVDQNLITQPHLDAKAGQQKIKNKIFVLNRYIPNKKKKMSLSQNRVY